MGRITEQDDVAQAARKLMGVNPGALRVLTRILEEAHLIDPDEKLQGLAYILMLDDRRIYGEDIWLLYKDLCRGSLPQMLAVLRGYRLEVVAWEEVAAAINHARDPRNPEAHLDPASILKLVQQKLPRFGMNDLKVS